MKNLTQDEMLAQLEDRVEGHIRQAVETLQNLPEPVLLQPAPDGGWSVAQCLEHLNSNGRYYLPHILQKLPETPGPAKHAQAAFRGSWLGRYFTQLMEPATGKRKLKAMQGHCPDRNLDAYAVVAEFVRQQETLLQCLRQARHADLNQSKIPISVARWLRLPLGDVFNFIVAHNDRHLAQAYRLLPVPTL